LSTDKTFSIVKSPRSLLAPREAQPTAIELATTEPLTPRQSLLRVIWRRRWVVLLAFVVGMVAGIIYIAGATPIYTSSSSLLVEQSVPKVISTSDSVVTQSRSYLYTQCKLLKSTPILAKAVELLKPQHLKSFAGSADWIGLLRANVAVNVGKADDIITVTAESPYPEEAAEIVNAIVESYVAYQSSHQRDTAGEILRILQREKVRRDAELKERFEAAMAFKRDHEIISFGTDSSNIILQRLDTLSAALTEAEMALMEAEARFETSKALLVDPHGLSHLQDSLAGENGSVSPQLAGIEQEKNKLILELASLRQECTDDHPAVQAVKMKLEMLEEQQNKRLRKLAGARLGWLKQQVDAARSRVEELTKALDAQRKLAQELNSKAVEYAMLDAERKRAERICDILDSRIKEIDITEDAGGLNISLLETGQPASSPSKPRKAQVMCIALSLGMLAGIGLAFVGEWLDHRFKSADEVTEALGLPVLGAMPQMSGQKSPSCLGRMVHLEPTSQAAEAVRTVRTAIYFGAPDIKSKTLLVTSPAQGDGKSTLASNLGVAMADAGQKVLILDADFRRPNQHKLFEIDADACGVTDVLAGEDLKDAIKHTDIDRLDVLPCGQIPPNPSEILHSQAFSTLLEKLSERYDHVLVDAPPVLPVADARILGAMCDAAILVVHTQKSSRKPTQRAVESLLGVGTRILGVVANGVGVPKRGYGYYDSDYGYGYGYGYRYGYGHDRRAKELQSETKEHDYEADAVRADSA